MQGACPGAGAGCLGRVLGQAGVCVVAWCC